MPAERIQKILAQVGIASRRKAEEMIQEGHVTVNGKIASLGEKAEWGKDAIKVKGKLLHKADSPVYIAFYKPKGVISMLADPQGRPTLTDFLGKVESRVFPVGRLDFNSEGLILLTNDGAFAEKLQKQDDVLRIYDVKIKGFPDEEMLMRIKRGARLGEFKKTYIKPHSVRLTQGLASNAIVEIGMKGGGAFDIKSLFDTRGFLVVKITRTAIGHITLRGLVPGSYRHLKASQVEALLTQPELGQKMLDQDIEKSKPVRNRQIPKISEEEMREGDSGPIIRGARAARGPIARGATSRPSTRSSDRPSVSPSARPPRDEPIGVRVSRPSRDDRGHRTETRSSRSPGAESRDDRSARTGRYDSRAGAASTFSPRGPSRAPRSPSGPVSVVKKAPTSFRKK